MTLRSETDLAAARPGWRRPWLVHPAVLAVYLLLTIVMTWPVVRQFGAAIPGDSFDGWQNYWNLWWVKLALVDRLQNPYFTDLLYHPTGVPLYFHTLNPFNGLVSLPVQLAAGLIPAYNTVMLFSWVLAGYGTYLLSLWVLRPGTGMGTLSPWARQLAAVTAGAIFTFSPFHMAHLLGHMQVMSLQWVPFYILDLVRAMEQSRTGRPWLKAALRAGLWLVLAGLCDWYFVLYLFLFSGLVVVWEWGRALGQGRWSPARVFGRLAGAVWPAAVAGAVFAVVLSPLLVPMVQEARRFTFMVRPTTDLYILSASLSDFLVPNRLHTLFRPESFTWVGNQIAPVSERTITIGYVALALAAVAVGRARSRAALWAVAGVFFVLVAMGPDLHLGNIPWEDIPQDQDAYAPVTGWTPYAVLTRLVPFMRISRSVSRFALLVQLSAAVLGALGLAVLLGARRQAVRCGAVVLVGGVCLAAVLAEFWVAPYPVSPPDTPGYYAELAAQPGDGAVLNLPMNYDRPGYLLYQTVHRRPLTVAYISRDDPRTLTERVPVLQHFRHLGPDIVDTDPVTVGMTVLADLGVSHVVLDRYKMPGGREREYTTDLAQAIFANQAPVYEDERLTVYTVTPPEVSVPYLELGPLGWGPLQETADGVARRIGEEPAALFLRHAPPGTALRVAYRTAPGATLVVRGMDAQPVWTVLPPSPEGTIAVLPVADLAASAGLAEAPTTVVLAANGEVEVTGLGLLLP